MKLPSHLTTAISEGRVVLVLGAGASVGSKNRVSGPIVGSGELAVKIATLAGLSYAGETLRDVFEGSLTILGDARVRQLFEGEFVDCRPSEMLSSLFSFSWRRIYTFNFDDAIRNTSRKNRVQRHKYYNALVDRRDDWSGLHDCQVVYLHGFAGQFSSGFVLSDTDYARLMAGQVPWYENLGEDFHNYTVVFIGSTLNEPTLWHHINRMNPNYLSAGRSYLIVPEELGEIRARSLKQKNIDHLRGTIDQFVSALFSVMPDGLPPDTIRTESIAQVAAEARRYTQKDLDALRAIYPVRRTALAARFPRDSSEHRTSAYKFYLGFGPTWPVILGDQYARLGQFGSLEQRILAAFNAHRRVVAVVSESGSGKSTCCMAAALRLAEVEKIPVFEFVDIGVPIRTVLVALNKHADEKRVILLLDELHIYAEELAEALESESNRQLLILTSARSGEWRSRLRIHLPNDTAVIQFSRFSEDDIDNIIDKTLAYYPAPAFTKLPRSQQRARFVNSRQQLLIALREATESRQFDHIMRDEFIRIRSVDARILFYIVGISTLARSGISDASAETSYRRLAGSDSFSRAITDYLSGIVDIGRTGRLQTRHEVYARYVIYEIGDLREIVSAISGIMEYFSGYSMPIIRHVNPLDGQIFKFVLNNRFLYFLCKRKGEVDEARELYETFSTKFQLDGHFWLQYGLLLRRLGDHEEAFRTFEKSIQAYPENPFAAHALAQQKLIVAALRPNYDGVSKQLIGEAIEVLLERHSSFQLEPRGRAFDEYPLVTLAYYHIDALMRHGRYQEATAHAKSYFAQIQALSTRFQSDLMDDLKAKLMLVVTHQQWSPLRYRKGMISYLDLKDKGQDKW